MDETRDTYTVIPGWTKRLGLSLVEKVVYSVIYGFSQDEDSTFHGSRSYLADICECGLRTIDRTLASLVEKGLIRKREKYVGGVKFCEYVANVASSDTVTGVATFCPKGSDKFAHNNEDSYESSNRNKIEKDARAHTRKDFDFKGALLDIGVSEAAASDWMLVRKNAKATNTRTAFYQLRAQIDKICRIHGVTPDDVVRFAVGHDWRGIDASWEAVKNIKAYADNLRNTEEDEYLPF